MNLNPNNPPKPDNREPSEATPSQSVPGRGGIIHSYQQYDPQNFPSPTAPPGQFSQELLDHLMATGDLDELSDLDLANAIRLDASMFPTLGPSIASLRKLLLEQKRKILERFETDQTLQNAEQLLDQNARKVRPPEKFKGKFLRAVADRQIYDLERIYDAQSDDTSSFASDLMRTITDLATLAQIEQLADAYSFTGREVMDRATALEVKEQLEEIDELLRQLEEAAKNATIAIIDFSALQDALDPDQSAEEVRQQIQNLNNLAEQIEQARRQAAQNMGLNKTRDGYRLTPKGLRALQKLLLTHIFDDLRAARSGRHAVGVLGQGVIQTEKLKSYEFGDDASNMEITQTIINAATARRSTPRNSDIAISLTRNNPRCATSILMDMSGSMRYDGHYINVKKMALALDALIRTEYPGDYLNFIEMYSLAKLRKPDELIAMLPKPVSIHSPRVRLRIDMADPNITEAMIPQHFTNIQHALRLARQTLGPQNTPNKQVILITDGLPTAHFDNSKLMLLYPPDHQTAQATMREALACKALGITINIFLLQNWNQSEQDVAFARALAQQTSGRVMFIASNQLDRFVVWDYVTNRRKILG